jgi:hypothetical protein
MNAFRTVSDWDAVTSWFPRWRRRSTNLSIAARAEMSTTGRSMRQAKRVHDRKERKLGQRGLERLVGYLRNPQFRIVFKKSSCHAAFWCTFPLLRSGDELFLERFRLFRGWKVLCHLHPMTAAFHAIGDTAPWIVEDVDVEGDFLGVRYFGHGVSESCRTFLHF